VTTRPLEAVQRQSLESQTYETMRRAILRGDLPAGRRLVQGELAAELGTSRIPVRDALKRLEADGLVTVDGRGTYVVNSFGPDDVREIYDLRFLLEPYAVERAMEHLEEAEIAELGELVDRMEAAAMDGDGKAYVQLNQDFHMRLYEASGHQRLIRMVRSLWSSRPLFDPIESRGGFDDSVSEHRDIMRAIVEGDVAAARTAVEEHITASSTSLQQRVGRRFP